MKINGENSTDNDQKEGFFFYDESCLKKYVFFVFWTTLFMILAINDIWKFSLFSESNLNPMDSIKWLVC
jgi:hypothetical protein